MISPVKDYYRRNFLSLLNGVAELYNDILTPEETAYIETFLSASDPAQCLYVRLVSRTGPLIRSDKVVYEEIEDVNSAAGELEAAGLLRIGAEYTNEDIIRLLLKDELARITEELGIKAAPLRMRKSELADTVLSLAGDRSISELTRGFFTVYEPLGVEFLTTLKLLFFGNFRQDLNEFIITNLGIVTYEDYPVEKDARPFSDRQTVDARIILHNAAVDLYDRLSLMPVAEIIGYSEEVRTAVPNPSRSGEILRRFERLINLLARQLERLGFPGEALSLYETTSSPPSRERRVRLYFASGNFAAAQKLCREIIAEPYN